MSRRHTGPLSLQTQRRQPQQFTVEYNVHMSRSRPGDLLFPRCCRGVFPLPKETMRAKLRVMPDKFGSQCLKLEDGQQKVKCEAWLAIWLPEPLDHHSHQSKLNAPQCETRYLR
jgi:hypothetical protein